MIVGELAIEPQNLKQIRNFVGLVFQNPDDQLLDPRSRRQLIALLDSLPLTQLIATHDLDLALELCDRTIVLNQGQIVYDGETERVLSNPELLSKHALESLLCYGRLYCQLEEASLTAPLQLR